KVKPSNDVVEVGTLLATLSVNLLLELFVMVASDTLNSNEAQSAALARAANVDMRDWWQPDAAHYLGLVPKALMAEAVAEVHGKAAGEKLTTLKKDTAIAEAGKLLANSGWLPKPPRGDGYTLAKPGTADKAAQGKAKPATKPSAKPARASAKKAASKK